MLVFFKFIFDLCTGRWGHRDIQAWFIDTLTRNRSRRFCVNGEWLRCRHKTMMRQMNDNGDVLWRVNEIYLKNQSSWAFRRYISCVYKVGFLDYREIKETAHPIFKDCPLPYLQAAADCVCVNWRQEVLMYHKLLRLKDQAKSWSEMPATLAQHMSPSRTHLHCERPVSWRA